MLLTAFCWQCRREIIDTLITLLIDLTHRIRVRAKRKVDRVVSTELKRARGKTKLLSQVTQASVTNPDGVIKDVIFPACTLAGWPGLHLARPPETDRGGESLSGLEFDRIVPPEG